MNLDEITVKVNVAADGVDEGMSAAAESVRNFGKTVDGVSGSASASYAAISAAAGTAFVAIKNAVQTGIEANNAYIASQKGLESVAMANGISNKAMQTALGGVTDAFFSASDAATAYKNLLSRGYTLDQATATITRLKDAAAFGRQSSYTLSQAVVTATEGLKNENSILVDNAGVTKNVSVMWKEYAASIGVGVQSLTQAQKIEAEYQGIMRETTAQVGDLAKAADTLAGSQAEASNQSMLAAQSFGAAMAPSVQLGTDMVTGFMGAVQSVTGALPGLTAGVTSAAAAFTGLAAAKGALETIKGLAAGATAFKAMLGPIGWVAAGLGALVGVYTAVTNAQEQAAEAEKARAQASQEAVTEQQGRVARLSQLITRYNELSSKDALSYSEQKELVGIKKELADAYGVVAKEAGNAAEAVRDYHNALGEASKKELAELLAAQKEAADLAYKAAHSNEYQYASEDHAANKNALLDVKAIAESIAMYRELGSEIANYQDELSRLNLLYETEPAPERAAENDRIKARIDDLNTFIDMYYAAAAEISKLKSQYGFMYDQEVFDFIDKQIESLTGSVQDYATKIEPFAEGFVKQFNAQLATALTESRLEGGEVNEALASHLSGLFQNLDLSKFDGDTGAVDDYVKDLIGTIVNACTNTDLTEAIEIIQEGMGQVMEGIVPSEEQREAMAEAWDYIGGEDSPIFAVAEKLSEMSGEGLPECLSMIMEMVTGLQLLNEEGVNLNDTYAAMTEQLSAMAEEYAAAGDDISDYTDSIGDMEKAAAQMERKVGQITGIKKNIDAYKDARKAYDNARKSGKDVEKAFDGCQKAAKSLGISVDKGTGSVKAMDKALDGADSSVDSLERGIASDGAAIISTLQGMLVQAQQTEDSLNIQAAMGVDVSQPLSAIQAVIRIIRALLALMGKAGIKPKGGGGGGGGGGGRDDSGSDSAEDDAEEEARKAEEARKEAIKRDYDYIEHKRHLNEITLEQELSMLERIRYAHQLNAEEIMEWEEKIYDLKQEIRERDAESIDTLADGVVEALENRYEAMRDAEIDRLDQSRKAWEQWRDDSVQAIQDQIDALDKLSDAEDNEAKDAEELRKIEKLRREVEYEQDEYNRAKLQQQLDAAIDSREERLRKLALKEQKEALREEIDRIDAKADDQIAVLDKEQEAIEAAYEERLKDASLQAEAEKLIMTQSQDEIMNLLYEYVPEYDALGKTMGEKLLEGFQSKVGSIVTWFKSFNEQLAQMQEQLAATTNAAADEFYQGQTNRLSSGNGGNTGVTVNQSVTFNEPVESPSQVARRIADVNDALGELLG